jgi:hypothetical protein
VASKIAEGRVGHLQCALHASFAELGRASRLRLIGESAGFH